MKGSETKRWVAPMPVASLLSVTAWSGFRLAKIVSGMRGAVEGICNVMCTPEELERLTWACYRRNYHTTMDTVGLFAWEERLFTQHIMRGQQVLVVGAGKGREVRALLERGCEVWVVEPDPAAADACRDLLRDTRRVVTSGFRELAEKGIASWAEDAPTSFDAILLGWGSLSHCFGADLRHELFMGLGRLCPDGPILCSFWYQQEIGENRNRANRFIRRVTASHERLQARGGGEPLQGTFMFHAGIALKMTDEELARLARAASKEIVQLDVHGVYPFAVMASPEPNS